MTRRRRPWEPKHVAPDEFYEPKDCVQAFAAIEYLWRQWPVLRRDNDRFRPAAHWTFLRVATEPNVAWGPRALYPPPPIWEPEVLAANGGYTTPLLERGETSPYWNRAGVLPPGGSPRPLSAARSAAIRRKSVRDSLR